MIRDNFNNITVFVPHIAASGGTLIALTGNKIFMGELSQLSPIDTQLGYKRETVSAQSYDRAVERLADYFKDKSEYEAAYIYKAMADQLDPVIREEWTAKMNEIVQYLLDILHKTNASYADGEKKYAKEDISRIVFNLIFTDYPHELVVHRDRAKEYKLNIHDDSTEQFTWDAMKAWYSRYVTRPESKHHIRYVVNKGKTNGV